MMISKTRGRYQKIRSFGWQQLEIAFQHQWQSVSRQQHLADIISRKSHWFRKASRRFPSSCQGDHEIGWWEANRSGYKITTTLVTLRFEQQWHLKLRTTNGVVLCWFVVFIQIEQQQQQQNNYQHMNYGHQIFSIFRRWHSFAIKGNTLFLKCHFKNYDMFVVNHTTPASSFSIFLWTYIALRVGGEKVSSLFEWVSK